MSIILDYLKKRLKRDDYVKSSSLAYNSIVEEALKLSLYAKEDFPLVIVKENTYLANRLYEELLSYYDEKELALFTPEESMRAEAIVASYENRALRINTLYSLIKGQPKIIVTSVYGLLRHLPDKHIFEDNIIHISNGDIMDKEALINCLNNMGYENVLRCETPMTYASRGAIVDVFSVNYQYPLRIEFFDDEIDSIRFYDVNTQRTINTVDECEIIFGSDLIFDDEDIESIEDILKDYDSSRAEIDMDYLRHHIYDGSLYYYYAFIKHHSHLLDYIEDPVLYLSNTDKINEHIKILKDETYEYLREYAEDNNLPLRFQVFGELNEEVKGQRLLKSSPYSEVFPVFEEIDLPRGPLNTLMMMVFKKTRPITVIAVNEKEAKEITEYLDEHEIAFTINNIEYGINLVYEDLNHGFESNKLDMIVYSGNELFNHKKALGKYARKYEEATVLNSYDELKKGDYVVHNQYGIGQYIGIEKRVVNNITLDYLKIAYRNNDELLVPLSQFSLVRKYVSKEGAVPKLHKLGSKEWANTKKKVEENVNDLAERLIELYGERNKDIGFAYSADNDIQREFEDEFTYELTKDQITAVKEVKKDMESSKPMDRLLCGDVGFGKTEVAIRASMKAVLDHKQVAYLCPTTILSMQHYKTFKDRFRNYPVKIAIMNRYVSKAEQKEIIKDLYEHKIDILIGTHRILSKDIRFKDLGLLIVDEEQRFGVEHKERIKELKTSIDVLSLSATPIPRTLQMSLVGLRGLSTLNSAPRNRYPVETYVVEKNEGLIVEVIERELSRGGQVFYLYNNVDHIYALARKIGMLVEGSKVLVAHGKMSSEELEDVMKDFYENKANILICTTIIETGIDIPNANTIIIDNAQNFGLSQLYQIKGRVGRSDKIAYAYLMVPPKKQLSETGTKRLNSIKEFTSLGSGYKIAMRDLSIRGAGDMLGSKQSGFIDNVGLDLYLSMLEKAIKAKKGEVVKDEENVTKPFIPLDSYIPESFTNNDYDKLNLYHRLDKIDNKTDLLEYYLEVKDEFGKLPKEIESLFDKKQIELLMELKYVESIRIQGNMIVAILTKTFSDTVDGMKLFEYCANLSKDIKIRYIKNKLEFSIQNRREGIKKILILLDHLDELTNENR